MKYLVKLFIIAIILMVVFMNPLAALPRLAIGEFKNKTQNPELDKFTDGEPRPGDIITGPAVAELNTKINTLITTLKTH